MSNKLYKSKVFPLLFQVISLIVFFLLIYGAFDVSTNDSKLAKQLRNTNLSNLIVWSYWWPLIVITAVLFGKYWCTICPIELLNSIFSKFSLKIKVPKAMKSGWFIVVLYAFIAIVAIQTWGMHRNPKYMSFYLLSLMGLAIITTLIFRKRAFCSYLCPVGKVLSLYAILSKFGLRVKQTSVCDTCKTKDCISQNNDFKIIGRSCQSELYPKNISDNKDCILCTQCIKVCPNDNITIKAKSNSYLGFDFSKISNAEIGMLIILMGFISYEIMTSWGATEEILLSIPKYFYKSLDLNFLPYKLVKAITVFIILPSFLIFLFTSIAKLLGKFAFKHYLKTIVGLLLPIIATGHLFKALLKTSSRIPYWEYALSNPRGELFAQKILNKEVVLASYSILDKIIIALGFIALILAFRYVFIKLYKLSNIEYKVKIVYMTLILAYIFVLLAGPISSLL